MDELDELFDWLELLEELELLDWLELLEELELLLAVGMLGMELLGILDEELGILGEALGILLDEVLGMLGADELDELDELGILGMLEDDDELEEDWQPTRAVMAAPTSTGAI